MFVAVVTALFPVIVIRPLLRKCSYKKVGPAALQNGSAIPHSPLCSETRTSTALAAECSFVSQCGELVLHLPVRNKRNRVHAL